MAIIHTAVLLLLACGLCCGQPPYTSPFKMVTPSGFVKLASSGNSSLYETVASGYAQPIQLLDLYGSHYEIGRAAGVLIGTEAVETINALMDSVLPKSWERDAVNAFLDWQWADYLSKQLPKMWSDEIEGFSAGAGSVGVANARTLVQRSITIGNFPGDVEANIIYLLESEAPVLSGERRELAEKMLDMAKRSRALGEGRSGMHCSQMAVWGNRTVDGGVFATRNLDWYGDTGIAKHKVVTVYHITGTIPYATVGFGGMLGALTGMNAAGVVFGESGSDVKSETFLGYAWLFRFRELLEISSTLNDALVFLNRTNNTLGMNHVVASAKDAAAGRPAGFAQETKRGYSAIFFDNDPRESGYTTTDNGKTVALGAPLPQAVYRTNHGIDPVIRKNALDVNKPMADSQVRYMLFHNSLKWYDETGVKVTIKEAVNMTTLVGDKGASTYDDFYAGCYKPGAVNGSTILSAAYQPAQQLMYVAYEEGHGKTHLPACCGTYVEFDLRRWF